MKKIKTYFTSLPKGVKTIVGINILVYFIFVLVYFLSGVELHNYFGAYPTYSENFHLYQIFTSMFVHTIEPSHIISNLIFILIFTPSVEKKIGTKNLYISLVFIGIFAYLFVNNAFYNNKNYFENQIKKIGINVEEIETKNGLVSEKYLINVDVKKYNVVKDYNYVISKTYGASGFLFGMILLYLLFNLKNIRKAIPLLLGGYFLYITIDDFINSSTIYNGSTFAHFGGVVGGLVFYIYFKTKKDIA
jgi:membrane associated rhomboid family serine protease